MSSTDIKLGYVRNLTKVLFFLYPDSSFYEFDDETSLTDRYTSLMFKLGRSSLPYFLRELGDNEFYVSI